MWQLTSRASIGSVAIKIRNPENKAHSGLESRFYYIICNLSIKKFLKVYSISNPDPFFSVSGVIVKNLDRFKAHSSALLVIFSIKGSFLSTNFVHEITYFVYLLISSTERHAKRTKFILRIKSKRTPAFIVTV